MGRQKGCWLERLPTTRQPVSIFMTLHHRWEGPGCTEMKLHAADCSHWKKTDSVFLSLFVALSLSLSQQWLAGIGTFTMYAIIWTDLEYRFDLTTREDVTVPKVYYILFSQGYNSILYARSSRTIWLIHQWTLFIHQPSIFIKEFSAHIGLPLMFGVLQYSAWAHWTFPSSN